MKKVKLLRLSSLLLLLIFSLAGCLGPKITACLNSPLEGGFNCKDQRSGEEYFIAYELLGVPPNKNYMAMPVNDYGRILDFMKNGCK